MRKAFRLGFAVALCSLPAVAYWATVGWRPNASPAREVSVGGAAAPRSDEGELRRQYQVAAVVERFMKALQEEEWAGAAELFCADFRRANEKELLDGSLLRYDPHTMPKSTLSIVCSPKAWVGRVAVRGDRAWAQIQGGHDHWAQVGITALELVREGDQWRLLRFPPSERAYDAAAAGISGEAAGRWFKSMLSDGDFSEEEQAEMADVLGGYYAMVVELEPQVAGRSAPAPQFAEATMEQLKKTAEMVKARPELRLAKVTFWRKPSEDVLVVSRALAEQAVSRIYEELAAVKDQFPELAKFDAEHVRLDEDGLSYRPPRRPARHEKQAPTIGVSIAAAYLGPAQADFPRILLPRQGMAVERHVGVDDGRLKAHVKQVIENNLKGLESFERVLGGTPVPDHW